MKKLNLLFVALLVLFVSCSSNSTKVVQVEKKSKRSAASSVAIALEDKYEFEFANVGGDEFAMNKGTITRKAGAAATHSNAASATKKWDIGYDYYSARIYLDKKEFTLERANGEMLTGPIVFTDKKNFIVTAEDSTGLKKGTAYITDPETGAIAYTSSSDLKCKITLFKKIKCEQIVYTASLALY